MRDYDSENEFYPTDEDNSENEFHPTDEDDPRDWTNGDPDEWMHDESDFTEIVNEEFFCNEGPDEPTEDDSWHDADTFTSIGWGTDEDYGHFDEAVW